MSKKRQEATQSFYEQMDSVYLHMAPLNGRADLIVDKLSQSDLYKEIQQQFVDTSGRLRLIRGRQERVCKLSVTLCTHLHEMGCDAADIATWLHSNLATLCDVISPEADGTLNQRVQAALIEATQSPGEYTDRARLETYLLARMSCRRAPVVRG